jgi:hypothetical protein
MKRFLPALLGLTLLVPAARAGWSAQDRYAYLSPNQTYLLILGGKERFVLQKEKDGGWKPAPETAIAAFDRWRKARKLPAKLDELVRTMPEKAAVPFAGTVTLTAEEPPTLYLKSEDRPAAFTRGADDAYTLDAAGDRDLDAFAKGLGAGDSAGLAAALAREDAKLKGLTDADWTPLVETLRLRNSVFLPLPKGVLAFKLAAGTPGTTTPATTSQSAPTPGTATPPQTGGLPLWALIGIIVLGVCGAAGLAWWFYFRHRTGDQGHGGQGVREGGSDRRVVPQSSTPATGRSATPATGVGSPVLANYGLLLQRLDQYGQAQPGFRHYGTNERRDKALEHFLQIVDAYPQLAAELEQLRGTDAAQARREADKAQEAARKLSAENDGLKAQASDMRAAVTKVEGERDAARRSTTSALQSAVRNLAAVKTALLEAERPLDGGAKASWPAQPVNEPIERWSPAHLEAYAQSLRDTLSRDVGGLAVRALEAEARQRDTSRLEEQDARLAQAVTRACHALVMDRGADAYSLAYAQLAHFSLAGLARAHASGDTAAAAGYLANLEAQRTASERSLSGLASAMDLAAWRDALEVFGPSQPPETVPVPHPQVDSLAKALRLVRDGTPPLRDFGRLYVLGDRGIHRIEPPL